MAYTFDDDTKSYKINVTWTPRLEGEQAFVVERIGDGQAMEFGPMSLDLVKPLIEERQAWVQQQLDAHRARLSGLTHGQHASGD